jgi:hypothetical protein
MEPKLKNAIALRISLPDSSEDFPDKGDNFFLV